MTRGKKIGDWLLALFRSSSPSPIYRALADACPVPRGVFAICTLRNRRPRLQDVYTSTVREILVDLQGKISRYLFLDRFSGFLASSIDIPGFFL